MKTRTFILMVFFWLISASFLNAQIVELQWNTFLGSSAYDRGYDITRDSSGNLYVTGCSIASWGSPVNAHSGGQDIFVACLNSSGNLIWNTFLGSSDGDYGYGIILNGAGNIYVAGHSYSTWGSPVNAPSGSWDVFVACLNSSGSLLWNTFMGSSNDDRGEAITLDSLGNVYVTGYSWATWGSPVSAFSGNMDGFVASLDSSGNLLWNTFLGSSGYEVSNNIELNSAGNIYVVGYSSATWGSPINAFSGNYDVFVAVLNSSGSLLWNTFLGSADYDTGFAIDLDNSGNIFATGGSSATWGAPLNVHSGSSDVFVACLDGSGSLLWNTFLGSTSSDYGREIVLDSLGNIYLAGESEQVWGSPQRARTSFYYVFAACLDNSGSLLGNTFMGTANEDYVGGMVLDGTGKIYLAGGSNTTWGSPINAHSGAQDAFVAELSTYPSTGITANGSEGPVSITQSDSLQIRVSLNTFGSTDNVDYWLAYRGPSGWVHYNNNTKKWEAGLGVTHQGALMDLNNKKVFQSKLSPGNYTFYFGVDMNMDGKVTKSSLYKDEVKVTVTSN